MRLALVLLVAACNSSDQETGDTAPPAQGTWQVVDIGVTDHVRAVGGVSETEAYLAGERGLVMAWDGSDWSMVSIGSSAELHDLWAVGPQDVYLVGESVVFHHQGAGWPAENLERDADWLAVWAASPEAVFVTGHDFSVHRWDGTAWQAEAHPAGGRFDLWGTSAESVWSAGFLGTVRYDGTAWDWADQDAEHNGEGVWSSGPDEAWVVGYAVGGETVGHVEHWDGERWQEAAADLSLPPLHAVWGSGPSDVWAVGDQGACIHYDGEAWTEVDLGTDAPLRAIWGSGRLDVWVVGDDGTVLHYAD